MKENKTARKVAALNALGVAPRTKPSNYPEPFASMMDGRTKRQLGDAFGLKNFGVNLTRLAPNAQSSLFHQHSRQDEFIYILEGRPTLITDKGEDDLEPGMCAGFAAGTSAHQLLNRPKDDVVYLEVGDRTPDDHVTYPADDLVAKRDTATNGWKFTHKDGTLY